MLSVVKTNIKNCLIMVFTGGPVSIPIKYVHYSPGDGLAMQSGINEEGTLGLRLPSLGCKGRNW